jgi:CRP/FNR family transcriptional regulator, anaerobic regulatory protein
MNDARASMLPKPRRPREKRTVPLTRATHSIAEFCDKTGLSEARVLHSIEDGTLRVVKVGSRQLILARQPGMPGISKPDNSRSNIFFRESASTLLGGRERFVPNGLELSELGKLANRTNFRAKAAVFTEDEPTIAVYMVTHGTARLYKMLDDGRRQILGFALPGDFLGLSVSDRYTYSVEAISQVAACQFPRAPFLSFLQANPQSLYSMLQASLRETSAARDHMLLLGRGSAEQRLAEFIISWRARIGRAGVLSNLVPLPMPRYDVADFLGLTIETVSRVLSKLEREGVVRLVPKGLRLAGPKERPLLFERTYRIRD